MSKSFVLVHGAFLGAWCWKRVIPLLQTQGFGVQAVTLTGVGERSHLLTRDVGLHTHVVGSDYVAYCERVNCWVPRL